MEAHPDVLAKVAAGCLCLALIAMLFFIFLQQVSFNLQMEELGWFSKPGVRVIKGRWQDTMDQLGQYDGIFFDTYSEFYEDLRYSLLLPQCLMRIE